MKESDFQHNLIDEIEVRFPGSIVLKNDPRYKRGIPDLTILYEDRWATLECKNRKNASKRPGQDYYVKRMNNMSFSSFIYPENKEEVLSAMEESFGSRRRTRISKSEQLALAK